MTPGAALFTVFVKVAAPKSLKGWASRTEALRADGISYKLPAGRKVKTKMPI
jgi:hypothetical protein